MKIVFIVSAGGAVMSRLLQHDFIKKNTVCVVSDRSCIAIETAKNLGIANKILESESGTQFSMLMHEYFTDKNIIFLSFYTKLLTHIFLNSRLGKVFNCHPTLLPSFKGLNGYEENINSGVKFIGCTLHEIDEGMDTGSHIIQAVHPVDHSIEKSEIRHKVFLLQYYTALQFFKWIAENRLKRNNGQWLVIDGRYLASIFSPNLDENFFEFLGLQNEIK